MVSAPRPIRGVMSEMFTVMNRIPVPAAAASGFEEQFAASMGAHLSEEAFTAWRTSASFRAAHRSSSPGMAGEVESFETVVAVGA